eukprot:9501824-Pyramimonas_sp.AAC.2
MKQSQEFILVREDGTPRVYEGNVLVVLGAGGVTEQLSFENLRFKTLGRRALPAKEVSSYRTAFIGDQTRVLRKKYMSQV